MADLIDRDAVRKAMRSCETVTHSIGYSDMIAILDDAPAVNRWISCRELMPEINDPVLTFDGRYINVERRIEYILDDDGEPLCGEWWIDGIEGDEENPIGLRDGTATHWMPLPEPPEKE